MGQALYRKYRSKSLSEVLGQEHITDTLAKAIKTDKISHAYLLTGPRGVGKTSIARILAHEINKLPYDGQPHLDIIEIDAASNNGVEDVRDLREKVFVAPASAKYKVYIIDEVHMLSKAAFNALLKTLEEPPAHVVFILATTEAHKLPATIISRTQRYLFRPIETDKVAEHLRTIATAEGMDITDDALQLIAKHGEGSFRDSISLLDQIGSHAATVDASDVRALLGIAPDEAIEQLLKAIGQGTPVSNLIAQLNDLYETGYPATAIAKQLSTVLRAGLIHGDSALGMEQASSLLAALLEVPSAHNPERYLEITLLKALPAVASPAPVAPPTTKAAEPAQVKAAPSATETDIKTPAAQSVPPAPVVSTKAPAEKHPESKPVAAAPDAAKPKTATPTPGEPAAEAETSKPEQPDTPDRALDEAVWQAVLAQLKQKYNTLYSIARMAQPQYVEDDKLELAFAFAFHQKRLSEAKNRQIVSDAVAAVIGRPIEIVCSLDPDLKLTKATPGGSPTAPSASEPADTKTLSTISNIFGGAELLES